MGRGKVIREDDKRLGNKFSNGAPRKYESLRQFKQAINAYFKSITKDVVVTDDDGNVINTYQEYLKPPTLQSLAVFMGFTYDGLNVFTKKVTKNDIDHEGYVEEYEMGKGKCEAFNVEQLFRTNGSTAGIQFLLKNNYGYEDKSTIDSTQRQETPKLDYSKFNEEQLRLIEQVESMKVLAMSSDNDE